MKLISCNSLFNSVNMLFEFVNSILFTKINRENFVNCKIKSYICNDEFENVNPMDIVSRIKFSASCSVSTRYSSVLFNSSIMIPP